MRHLALLCIASCLIGHSALAAEEHPGVGDAAPDFTTKDLLTHERITLSQQQGKLVFLTFWASWCGPCRKEIPILEGVQRKLGKERAVVLGVIFNDNNEPQIRKWAHDNGVQMALLEDWGGHIAAKYHVRAIPHLYIIGGGGRILNVHSGYGPGSLEELVEEINAALHDVGATSAAAPTAPATAPTPPVTPTAPSPSAEPTASTEPLPTPQQ